MRFGKKGKLAPRFIGPFEILERVGTVAYRLALPPDLAEVRNVFHVSILRKYHPDPSHVLQYEPLELQIDMSFKERPVQIVDRRVKQLRNKDIALVKVLWQYCGLEEATWEREDEMRARYPQFLFYFRISWDEISLRRGVCKPHISHVYSLACTCLYLYDIVQYCAYECLGRHIIYTYFPFYACLRLEEVL
ncbi:Chromo domain-containing protein [Cephalotus follicularis]|uniref:Chromo domain-containing protein n=1 Tax=Cephalotus follicularis TaxID=3775 RepID=A0A1Q3CWZ9_CEPFO|nr:Chromo domain-containing protein [Cephalotus follicularis]